MLQRIAYKYMGLKWVNSLITCGEEVK